MLLQNYLNSIGHLYKWLVVFLLAITTGCAESLDTTDIADEISQQPSVVRMFPVDFFDDGYTEDYLVYGFDGSGNQFAGSYRVETGTEEVFSGEFAIPVTTILSYSLLDSDGIPVTSPIEIKYIEYFTSSAPRRYLGSFNTSSLVISSVQGDMVDIPETILSGTAGLLSNVQGSDSSIENIRWSVTSNPDDTFDIVLESEHMDSSGGLINHETRTFVIDSSGKRLYFSLVAEVASINDTLSFFGTLQ